MLGKVFTCCFAVLSTSSIAQQLPISVEAPVAKVFIPAGFDDNDQVEVMLDIEFPDACYRFDKVSISAPIDNTITIQAFALRYKDDVDMCTQVITPFLETVNLGLLKQGIYSIVVNPGSKEIKKTISIGKRTTDLPDEHLYAPVEFADIVEDPITGERVLFVQGRYPLYLKGCSKIVDIVQERDAEDLLTVLPIMKMFDGDECGTEPLQFKRYIPLEIPFTNKGLLYVRKFEGSSLSKLVNK